MISTVFKSPSFGWLVGFIVTVIAWATGKLDL
jgi:biotin transporter BioY